MAQLLICPPPVRTFPGFSPEAVTFLRELRRNNCREWFCPRQEEHQQLIQAPMLDLAGCLSREFARFAPDYVTTPDKAAVCMHREGFCGDEARKPYASHVAAIFARRGAERLRGPCFYFHFTDKELLALAGVYSPEPDELLRYRALLAEHYPEFREILVDPALDRRGIEFHGDPMSRVPKGFYPGHPASSLLRLQQWFLVALLDVRLLTTAQLLEELVQSFEAMSPLVEFLNRAFPK